MLHGGKRSVGEGLEVGSSSCDSVERYPCGHFVTCGVDVNPDITALNLCLVST